MEFSTTLKKNYEFRRLYSHGKSAGTHTLVTYARRNRSGVNRLGITVSGKIGGAVIRNRVRRRIREIYRLNELKMRRGYDIVIVARARSVQATYRDLEKSYLMCCQKLGLLAGSATKP